MRTATILALVVSSCSYVDGRSDDGRVVPLNERIARDAPAWAPGQIVVVDHHSGFDLTRFTDDGIHPNAYGDRHMAGRWFAALSRVFSTDGQRNSTDAPIRILPFGDSITEGSYRWDLWLLLRAMHTGAFDFVGVKQSSLLPAFGVAWTPALRAAFDQDHAGHSGWTTAQLADIAFDVAAATLPDVVLYHAGTNDFRDGVDDAAIDGALAGLRVGVGEVLRATPNATVLVAQIIPADWRHGHSRLAPWLVLTIVLISTVVGCCGVAVLLRVLRLKWKRSSSAAQEAAVAVPIHSNAPEVATT